MIRKNILITGASSGLGAQLSIAYASADSRLFLFGRCKKRLDEIANICLEKRAIVLSYLIDVRDRVLMQETMDIICNNYNLDIVIACAGVSAGTLGKPERIKQVQEIFDTNLHGTLNVVVPALPSMIKNNKGNIVIVSSMAGLLGLSSAPSYCSSKAAVKIFGDSLRGYLKKFSIRVHVVIAGYIETPMTEVNEFPMPFIMKPQKAAKIIIKGIEKNKGIIAFPLLNYCILKFLNILPYFIIDFFNAKLPGKPPLD